MNVDAADLPGLLDILGCRKDSFPQTYLGMPLSNVKLNLSAFTPLIARVDKYLSGWQASLLNAMGRTVLVNAVLDSSLIYILSAMMLPQGTIEELDKRRRAFLWTGDDKCNGSKCLLKWESDCTSKECGGLGVKNLEDQNHCLLMKFVHKLHEPSSLPWKNWYLNHTSSMDDSFLCRLILAELPRYRSLTSVQIGNGQHTSFWRDKWILSTTLAQAFPALFSHYTIPRALSVLLSPRGSLSTSGQG